nr:MAG TPA: hypothetical protein [Caudoviricetes sp.]
MLRGKNLQIPNERVNIYFNIYIRNNIYRIFIPNRR